MKSLFNESVFNETINRINSIDNSKDPQWGKMSAAQMFAHNVIPIEVVLEKRPPVGKPNFLMKLLFKKMLYNDKLFKKNMPTPKPFRIEEERDFETEKRNLIETVEEVYNLRGRDSWPKHPMFGTFTTVQTGQMLYKHLDHHLRQFGV